MLRRLGTKQLGLALTACALMFAGSALAADIGVTWAGKSGMTNRVMAGFNERMKELNADINTEVVGELADMAAVAEVVTRFQKEKAGMVVLRSTGAEYLGKNPPTIPAFVGGANHPPTLGALQNMEAPEGNVTGVTYFVPHLVMMESFQALYPDLTSALLVLEDGHPGSPVDEKGVLAACEELVMDCTAKSVKTVDEAAAAISQGAGSVSAIFLGVQSLLTDNAEKLVAAAGKLPVFAFTDAAVPKGALAGFSANDQKLGRMLAESVVDVVVNGKAIKDVPVKTDPEPVLAINETAAARLGIEIPHQFKETAKLVK